MSFVIESYRALRLAAAGLRFHLAPMVGASSRHGIAAGYKHREKPGYFDDTANSDNWQREVYEQARILMKDNALSTVNDIGCGSGYKLVHLLGEFDTTGVDLPETIAAVQQRYPDRRWVMGRFEDLSVTPADLVVCSDVIEHVADPQALIRFVVSATKEWVVLSTPAREIMYKERQRLRFGPPDNPTHLREWTVPEFRSFVEPHLEIVRHEITNLGQATQMIIGRKRLDD